MSTVSSVANRRSYDAFGAARNVDYSPRPNGTLNLPATIHGFTGHTHADDVALIHMGGRIYDPNLGRFLSSDPIIQDLANGQSINPYSYVLNNPFSGRDPTGYAIQCNDNKTCGTSDAPTQDEQQWKKSGPLLPKSNGADGLTAKGPQSQPVDGSAADIGTPSRTINGLGVTQLDNVVVRPDQDWVASRDVTWNIYGAERAAWADRLAQQSGYDMIRGFYGFQWEMWKSQFTGDVPVVGIAGSMSGPLRTAGALEDVAAARGVWSFRNLAPTDEILPAVLFPASKIQAFAYSGRMNYVVLESGELVIGRTPHTSLSKGANVLAAGEAQFVNGNLRSINNSSGHYRPIGDSAKSAAESAFNHFGFDAFGKYAEKAFQ